MRNGVKKLISIIMCLIMFVVAVPATKVEADTEEIGEDILMFWYLVDENDNKLDISGHVYTDLTSVNLYYSADGENFSLWVRQEVMPGISTSLWNGTMCEGAIRKSNRYLPVGTYYFAQDDELNRTRQYIDDKDGVKCEFVRLEYGWGQNTRGEDRVVGESPKETMTAADSKAYCFYLVYKSLGIRDFNVNVVWNDDNDRDGKRPESVTVPLYANGELEEYSLDLNSANKWKGSFNDLVAYDSDGNLIDYTVGGESDGYTISVTGKVTYGLTVTYKHVPEKVSLKANVVWNDENDIDGIRPESVNITRLKENSNDSQTQSVNAESGWEHTFDNLFKNENKQPIAYTVDAEDVEGYTKEISGNADDGFTITYSHTAKKMNLPVEIQWNDNDNESGIRPDEVEVTLLKDETATENKLTLKDADNWSGQFEKVDKFQDDDTPIVYSVSGANITNYELTSVYDEDNHKYVLTYTYKKEELPPNPPINNDANGSGNESNNGAGNLILPNTGDSSNASLWIALMGLSVLAFSVVLGKKYRIKKNYN